MSGIGLPCPSRVGAPLPNPSGQSPRAAVPVSSARAEASRQNGVKSRGPKTEEGRVRSAQNALKHGMRAQKCLVLPDEDAAEFAALEAAMDEELAPVGALQAVLARRVAVAAWRLARAYRLAAGTGVGARSPTRWPTGRAVRGAPQRRRRARARPDPRRQRPEVARDIVALPRRGDGRVLARAAHAQGAPGRAGAGEAHPFRPAARPRLADRAQPNEPERGPLPRPEYLPSEPPASGSLHEPVAPGCRTNPRAAPIGAVFT
jgi:hypothetical protein